MTCAACPRTGRKAFVRLLRGLFLISVCAHHVTAKFRGIAISQRRTCAAGSSGREKLSSGPGRSFEGMPSFRLSGLSSRWNGRVQEQKEKRGATRPETRWLDPSSRDFPPGLRM